MNFNNENSLTLSKQPDVTLAVKTYFHFNALMALITDHSDFYSVSCEEHHINMIKGKVENIKDKIDGNELDLSLSNLTEVPVKELVSVASDYSLYNYHVYVVLFTLKKMYSFSLSLGKV